jgi:hypothetical protein
MISTGCTLGARFQRLLPVAYSDIWYLGSGLFVWNFAKAASRTCIVLMALGDLEIRDFELLAWLRIL